MARSDIDWAYLGRDLRRPVWTLGVVAVVLILSVWLVKYEGNRYVGKSADQDVVNADYNALVVRKRLVDRYHRRYEQFRQQGFVATENRLDWIETLRESTQSFGLPSLQYSIEPQRRALAPVQSTSNDTSASIFLSKLEFDAGLVHEGDLLRLFDSLQSRAPGLLRIEECTLSRLSTEGELQAVDANIVAHCVVDMFSVVTADVSSERMSP